MSRIRATLTAIAVAAATWACAEDIPVQPEPLPPGVIPSEMPEREIRISDSRYSPSEVFVLRGTLVRWINDGPLHVHGSASVTGVWHSGEICSPTYATEGGCRGFGGVTFGRLFSKPGTYSYYCPFHPEKQGTVVVSEAAHAGRPR